MRIAYLEGSNSYLHKAALAIEAEGSVIVRVHAQQEVRCPLLTSAFDGEVHHAAAGAAAVEAGEEIDSA